MKNMKDSSDLFPWLALRFLSPRRKVAKGDRALATAQVANRFGYRFTIENAGLQVSLSSGMSYRLTSLCSRPTSSSLRTLMADLLLAGGRDLRYSQRHDESWVPGHATLDPGNEG